MISSIDLLARSSLMLCSTPFTPKRTDCRNVSLEALLLRTIRSRCQFDQRMQRNLHPRALLLRHIHVIRIDAPQHRLMRNNDDILTALQFHDDGLKPNDDIAVALAATVAIIVFIIVAGAEIFGVAVCDFLIG